MLLQYNNYFFGLINSSINLLKRLSAGKIHSCTALIHQEVFRILSKNQGEILTYKKVGSTCLLFILIQCLSNFRCGLWLRLPQFKNASGHYAKYYALLVAPLCSLNSEKLLQHTMSHDQVSLYTHAIAQAHWMIRFRKQVLGIPGASMHCII